MQTTQTTQSTDLPIDITAIGRQANTTNNQLHPATRFGTHAITIHSRQSSPVFAAHKLQPHNNATGRRAIIHLGFCTGIVSLCHNSFHLGRNQSRKEKGKPGKC